MAFRLVTAALLAFALVLPTAHAHTAIHSADGKVRGSVGLLDEPVSTYMVTGLDVCFTQNTTTTPRPAVNVADASAFTARLRAPSGAVHTADVQVPFGRPNCLAFAEPLVLTEPGQYLVDLSGSINGTTFAVAGIKAGGAVIDRGNITFPAAGVASDDELQRRVVALESRLADLENAPQDDGEAFAPGAPAAWLLAGLVALAAFARRRAQQ